MLTQAQQDQAIALLRSNADAARSFIAEKTSGFWHGLISGDTGGGELTYVETVQSTLIPRLQSSASAARADAAKGASWIELAGYAEQSLRDVQGYAIEGSVASILSDTLGATVDDIKDAAPAIAFGLGTGIAIVGMLGAFLYLGGRK
jgi:hypothetical protein